MFVANNKKLQNNLEKGKKTLKAHKMKQKTDYMPSRQGELSTWEKNFLTKIDSIAASLGIPPAEVQPVKDSINEHMEAYKNFKAIEAQAKGAASNSIAKKKSTVKLVRKFGMRIKSNPLYAAHMGVGLGIVCKDKIINLDTAKPRLKLLAKVGNRVRISFSKPQVFTAVKIFSRRGAETEFTFLAIDTMSPYDDHRPLLTPNMPEKRAYYAQFYIDDKTVGQLSNISEITV